MRTRNRSLSSTGEPSVFRPLLLLAVTVFIDLLGFGIILPNLPQYVKLAVGPDDANAARIAGWLGASYSLTQFLCAPFWGRYSDRAGRRPVILISLIGIAIAYVLFAFSNGHLWMLFAARLLAGLLSSASIGVAFAYVADVTTPENRAKGLGLLGACFGLGFASGPAFGGILAEHTPVGWPPLSLPAFVAAGMALLNFLFSLRMLPESLTPEERGRLAYEHRDGLPTLLLRVLRSPAGRLFILSFVVTFSFAAMEQIFSYYLLARGIATDANQPKRTGIYLGMVGVVSIIVQGGLVGRLVPKLGEGKVVRIGFVLLAAGYATLVLPGHWGWLFFLPGIPLAAGRSLLAPALSALISRKAQLGQGLVLSTSQGFDALARTLGPVAAAQLFTNANPGRPYLFSAGLTIVALLLTFVWRDAMTTPTAT
jgi:multidrug resistance protein